MKRIAVTGGVAEGKSTVLGYLREQGFPVCSADDIAREVFRSEDVQREIARVLGTEGPVVAGVLRAHLDDEGTRRKVNALTHPRILARLNAIREGFVETPLLIETCLQGEFDRIWVVTCGPEAQFERLAARVGETEARALIRTQLATRAKIPFADRVVRTNEPETSVMRSVSLAAQRDFW